jgi:hypothetical protein
MSGWVVASRTYGPGAADVVRQALKAGKGREVEI